MESVLDRMKRCPFCGGEANMQTFTTAAEKVPRYRVKCLDCWCMTDWDNFSTEEAAAKWDRRTEAPK